MTLNKKNGVIYIFYAAAWIFSFALFIFEVPRLVFWAPIFLFAVAVLYSIYEKYALRFSISAAVLILFGVLYVYYTYDPSQSLYYQSYVFLHSFFLFFIGLQFFNGKDSLDNRFEAIKKLILIVSLLYMIYVFITYAYYLRAPELAPADRKYWSVWYPGRVIKTATGFCASMMFAVAWGAYSVFFSRKKYEKITGAALVVLCFAFNIITKTRLLVFVTPVIVAAVFLLWLIFSKKKKALGVILIAVGAAVLIGCVLLYSLKKDYLKDKLADTVFYRFVDLGMRSTRWRYLLNVLRDISPFYRGGGVHTDAVGVPHNFWLYVYDFGGFLPFAVYTLFSILIFIDYISVLISKKYSLQLKVFISVMLFVVVLEFMVEDLLYALPSFVLIAHFIFGLCAGLAMKNTNKQEMQKKTAS